MLSKNQLKNITSLHTKKNRDEEQLFLIEGEKMMEELFRSDFRTEMVFAQEDWIEKNEAQLGRKKIPCQPVTEAELKKISLLSAPNKVLAIAGQRRGEVDLAKVGSELYLYLDAIRDPGNMGTIIRLAHWFGVSQVICSPDCVELYNPKVVQSTMGSIFSIRVCEAVLSDLISDKTGFPVFGALLDGENIYGKDNFTSGILVIGNESNGISEKNLPLISDRVKIPPAAENHAESLNAAMATAVFLSEYLRRKK
ncbi:MAG: putative tRNA/rRNA methyltransferase [Bacteroidetes bacterium]|jgi:TrmH family RNA methyltransferase|nr:putative tRNA/rRNA methyltransferase [Bacteroidota bacterium]